MDMKIKDFASRIEMVALLLMSLDPHIDPYELLMLYLQRVQNDAEGES